ncbi:hypothetical protein EJ05DRAFT_472884 [Pseudovirgaria hyperparasitica]|uniref:VPS37 C-terminal domain-containing protein n=1 Tax=Pseudovirgaria hyperparasitica TaxID=470096 RepID=A0A6A6WII0_9PEZI|nr:uncharacterized protein EJ05DRAFT_472884 [Pseudovirgaria hyperparasitica]KAF2761935.1 hypothetical protein EJ05DRAFT_472884 [Pseudovirgaria hyperparasitica]
MSYQSPNPAHFHDPSTPPPPPPPPKPSVQSSGQATPLSGPPLPPPPPEQSSRCDSTAPPTQSHPQIYQQPQESTPIIQRPEEGWLPNSLTDKTTTDLHTLLSDPDLLAALAQSPDTTHPSLPASAQPIRALLSANLSLASSLKDLESRLSHQRQSTQSRLLSLRALERQWRAKQAEQDTALQEFSPPSLYQRLSAAAGEQDALCRGLEESFLDEQGLASEREVGEFVRRYREGRKTAWLRRERKERWDEGRVGGWR